MCISWSLLFEHMDVQVFVLSVILVLRLCFSALKMRKSTSQQYHCVQRNISANEWRDTITKQKLILHHRDLYLMFTITCSIEYTVKTNARKTIFLRCWVQNNKTKMSFTQKVSVQAFFLSDWCLIYMRSGTLVQWDFSVGRATRHNEKTKQRTKCSDKKIIICCFIKLCLLRKWC